MKYEPKETRFYEADDVFFKMYELPRDAMVPQHAHDYDHTTLIASGKVRAWVEGGTPTEYVAPAEVLIKAHTKHTFLALEPAVLYCIHNLRGRGDYKISEEHVWR